MFLRLLGLTYLIAFVSLETQIRGLIGADGILPARAFLDSVRRLTGPERYHLLPTLCWLDSSDGVLQLLCVAGAILSLMLMSAVAEVLALILLWAFYLSLQTVGGDFLSFQWDILLLETGFLAVFLVPFELRPSLARPREPPRAIRWLLLWLLFRLMFSSGAVKLLSGDPAWRDATALTYHFETQPLPTWIGWYAHQLPLSVQKLSCLGMYAVELVAPFLIFTTGRGRAVAFMVIVAFQLLIAATGNYCFFNLLTIALGFLLLDDEVWPRRWRERFAEGAMERNEPLQRWLLPPVVIVILSLTAVQLTQTLGLRVPWPTPVTAFKRWLDPFQLVSGYGLFAVMTKTRPEIVVEGSQDGEDWKEYEFRWKPGDLRRAPRFVEPHQPRLDWQMWFAALGTYEENPWFRNFLVRLLQGSPNVVGLMGHNPFPDAPPRYVRALLYEYRFSDLGEKRIGGHWWRRERKGLYSPVLSLRQKR
jgi:hypothetical protein